MKRKEFQKRISEIESKRGDASCSYSTEKMMNEQVRLFKFFVELLNDFNEETSRHNRWLIVLTIVIAILTLVLTVKTFL